MSDPFGLLDPPSQEEAEDQQIEKQKRWLFIFISLFLALLALFILIISSISIEGAPAKLEYEKLVKELYQSSLKAKKQNGYDWLLVENTLSKGVRFTFDRAHFPEQTPLFPSARATVNPRYLPYIKNFSRLLSQLQLEQFEQRYASYIKKLRSLGYETALTIRVEGHTDSLPLAKTAFYRNNVELSTFRAYRLMTLLQQQTRFPPKFFAIAGYGSFHPLTDNPADPINRRVEIYLLPRLLPQESLSVGAKNGQ